MKINWREVKNLPVYTVSGSRLGNVKSVVLDIDTNVVFQYEVRSRLFGGRTFLINPTQIVEWRTDRMVVEDGVSASALSVNLVSEG